MSKTADQIKKEIEKLVDELELDDFKERLLQGLKFSYRLQSFEDEDYSKLGNTRFGGLPDLPQEIEYPYKEEGYYNLLCQLNFAEFEDKLDKLPEKGILYIFNGHSSENDSFTIFTESLENLEKKYPPKGIKNLNSECREDYYDGLKVKFGIEPDFDGTLNEVYRHDKVKYQALLKLNYQYDSHILGRSLDDTCHIYMHLKDFDTIASSVLPYLRGDNYQSQLKHSLKKCDEALNKPDSNKEHFKRKKEQLLKLDREIEIHIEYYNQTTCLIGLESLNRLGWMWSDMGYKYAYILTEDLKKKNFENMVIEWWSS